MLTTERIPNNVNLSDNKRLQRALEHWQPKYDAWWRDMGPAGFQDQHRIYLRTAVSVDPDGWAHYDYVKMPDTGGAFSSRCRSRTDASASVTSRDSRSGRTFRASSATRCVASWSRRATPSRPVSSSSVSSARSARASTTSRNLFQVNVEEGRHLWAMAYILHSFFGRDGRDEAEELLERRSGNEDKPRILDAFNEPIENWLDFFMFAMFTDRDGKSQLMSLSESAFDPLSRTTRFMLTEESFHMFVGESGISRILERTCELMKSAGYSEDVRKLGGIDLPTIQKFLNLWFSVSVDLHGSEVSSNAATYFANGLKGRAKEAGFEDHKALHDHYHVEFYEDGAFNTHAVPMRQAMNEVLRDWYVGDCAAGVARWNRVLERHGIADRLKLPNRKFHREIGIYSGFLFDPDGHPVTRETWEARKDDWLPTDDDRAFIKNLMSKPVYDVGKFANWISPAPKGINRLPVDFEYVRTEG